jgi:DNA polymerase I-like protein with 3'-5' exonuclease and polymerase domains
MGSGDRPKKEKKRRAKEAKARGEEVSEGGEEEAEEEDTDAYDVESFELREVAPIHVLMERTYNEMQKLSEKNEKLKAVVAEIKAKHPDVLKYVEDQGILKGLEIAVGVKDIPAAVVKEVEARASAK